MRHLGHDAVPHPDAVYVVGDGGTRHYRSVTGGTLCVTWWKAKELRPSDGVYGMDVCGRCIRIRGDR